MPEVSPSNLDEILEAVATLHRGDREAGRTLLAALWARLSEDDAFGRAIVGHYLADAQDTPEQELHWDLLALAAVAGATSLTLVRTIGGERITLASFLPSLHLNLAADYERLGDPMRARDHARLAADHLAHLDDSPLAELTRAALGRLRARLG